MLILGDVVSVHTDAEHLTGRNTGGAAERHEDGVDIGARAGFGVDQRADIAGAAAFDIIVAVHVGDDPVIDRSCLTEDGGLILRDIVSQGLDFPVDHDHAGRFQILCEILGDVTLFDKVGTADGVAGSVEGNGSHAGFGFGIGIPLDIEHAVALVIGVELCLRGSGSVKNHVVNGLVFVGLGDGDPDANDFAFVILAHVYRCGNDTALVGGSGFLRGEGEDAAHREEADDQSKGQQQGQGFSHVFSSCIRIFISHHNLRCQCR